MQSYYWGTCGQTAIQTTKDGCIAYCNFVVVLPQNIGNTQVSMKKVIVAHRNDSQARKTLQIILPHTLDMWTNWITFHDKCDVDNDESTCRRSRKPLHNIAHVPIESVELISITEEASTKKIASLPISWRPQGREFEIVSRKASNYNKNNSQSTFHYETTCMQEKTQSGKNDDRRDERRNTPRIGPQSWAAGFDVHQGHSRVPSRQSVPPKSSEYWTPFATVTQNG